MPWAESTRQLQALEVERANLMAGSTAHSKEQCQDSIRSKQSHIDICRETMKEAEELIKVTVLFCVHQPRPSFYQIILKAVLLTGSIYWITLWWKILIFRSTFWFFSLVYSVSFQHLTFYSNKKGFSPLFSLFLCFFIISWLIDWLIDSVMGVDISIWSVVIVSVFFHHFLTDYLIDGLTRLGELTFQFDL